MMLLHPLRVRNLIAFSIEIVLSSKKLSLISKFKIVEVPGIETGTLLIENKVNIHYGRDFVRNVTDLKYK
jgi:hypothetical protein